MKKKLDYACIARELISKKKEAKRHKIMRVKILRRHDVKIKNVDVEIYTEVL